MRFTRVNSRASAAPVIAVHDGYGQDAVTLLYIQCCGTVRFARMWNDGVALSLRCAICFEVTEIEARAIINPYGIAVDEADADELARLATDSVI